MKLTNFKKGLLHDERLVKRPATAYITFCAEELRAGSNVKAAAEKWKTLSEAEKKVCIAIFVFVYVNLAANKLTYRDSWTSKLKTWNVTSAIMPKPTDRSLT